MALSKDQKAMLRLLAQREQGYEDIAALMGLSVDELRSRVKDALNELEGEEEPQTPPAPPPRPEPVPPSPPPASPAKDSSPQPESPPGRQSSPPQLSLPDSIGARAAIAAGAIAIVLLVAVLVIGNGGSNDSTTASGENTTSESQPTSGTVKEVTKAVLKPVDGGNGTGVAIFGRIKDSLALQIEAEGLEPTSEGDSYTIWIAESLDKMLPLAVTEVGSDGRIGAQAAVRTEVLNYLANEIFGEVYITKTRESTLQASLKKATEEKEAPEYTGTPILRGTITGPIVGIAKKSGE